MFHHMPFFPGETRGGITNLGGIFLLEGLFMPFSPREVCISFGETFFSLKNFFFFISCVKSSNK